eukprot:PhF_6_TR9238/c0_g2_i1/m.14594
MDSTLGLPNKQDHIHVLVSLNNIVALKTMERKKKRPLIHLPLPPILPLNFPPESISSLPPCVQSVLDETQRKAIPESLRGIAVTIVDLLRSSCGHPGRLQKVFYLGSRTLRNVFDEVEKSKKNFSYDNGTILTSCHQQMRMYLDIERICSHVSKRSMAVNLLTGLFTAVSGRRSQRFNDMMEATSQEYQ